MHYLAQSFQGFGVYVVQLLASIGTFLFGACVVGVGIVAIAFCTGLFFEQFGPAVFKANRDKCVNNGLKTGALLGFAYSLYAVIQLGTIGALFSLIGLVVVALFLTWLTWFIADTRRPYNPEFD